MDTTATKARTLRIKLIIAAVTSCFASAGVLANPTGGVVVNGTASITDTPGALFVDSTSAKAIINWQGFSIGAGELTRFNQPSASSAVLNRVLGGNASEIFGMLQSNGRVFLINQNGIVFGPGSTVDVAGLVASSLNLSDADFLAGTMRFQGVPGAGAVTNLGSISAQPGGEVYLVGPAVTNGGVIYSPQGEVVLAAGNSVELVSPGTPGLSVTIAASGNQALNLGQIFADSGRVGIFAGLVDQSGYVQANTAVLGEDGTIKFEATSATTLAAGSQTVSTGELNIDSGSLVVNGGVFSGPQTIHADSILVQGGSSGGGQAALLVANSGSQDIWAGAGGLTVLGGAGGGGNYAMINQVSTDAGATQTIHSDGLLLVQGGEGSTNFALVRGYGGHQDVEAGNATLLAGAGGIDNFASIQAPVQSMTVHGDLTLQSRGSERAIYGGGVKLGGLGGAGSPTELGLQVEGNLTLTGGSTAGTAAVISNTSASPLPNDVSVVAGGDVTLNGGTGPNTQALIGAVVGSGAGGNIDVSAGGTIALNSTAPDAYGVIRTADGVTLSAQQVTEEPDARIEAGSLTTMSAQGASLTGANAVSTFHAVNAGSGAVALSNTSPLLTVTGIDQVASDALSLEQAGDLLVAGNVSSGTQSMSATGDLTVTAGNGGGVTVLANGTQTFTAGGSFSLLGGSAWNGYAQTGAVGPVRVNAANDVNIGGGRGLLAYALLYGRDSVSLTVGDELHVDGGRGLLAFGRVQTSFGGRIYLDFPLRASGGYFVDGGEGATQRGLDGFFTGLLPARRGRSPVVTYGG